MTFGMSRVTHLSSVFVDKRRFLTGFGLPVVDGDMWPQMVVSEAEFQALVSSAYIWIHEQWGDEINYVVGLAPGLGVNTGVIKSGRKVIKTIRQTHQHTASAADTRYAESWYEDMIGRSAPASEANWRICSEALQGMCESVLGAMIEVANAAIRDDRASVAWRQRTEKNASVDVPTEVQVVLADVGLRLSPGQLGHVTRAAEHDWNRRRVSLGPSDDATQELLKVVERVVVGFGLTSLPVNYEDILSAVNPRGLRESVGALVLAHAISDLVDYNSAANFVEEVSRWWSLLHGEAKI